MKVAVCFTPDRPKCLATIERMAQAQTLYVSQSYQIFKADFKLYFDLYQRHFPAARAVPYCSGGKLVKGVGFDPSYYVHMLTARSFRDNRYVTGALRRLGLRYQWWHTSALIARAIALVDVDHPDLNAPTVQLLKRDGGARDRITRAARNLVLYWQTWRWMMEGHLRIKRKDFLFP